MDKIALFKELWRRINSGNSNTPPFFQKVKAYSFYIILAIGVAFGLEWGEVIAIPEKLSVALMAIAGYFLGSGSTAAATVEDPHKAGIAEDSKYKPKD